MNYILGFLAAVIFFVWCFTGGTHWASACLMTAAAVAGACIVLCMHAPFRFFKSKNSDDPSLSDCISQFHGFGPLGWMIIAMIAAAVVSLIPIPLSLLEILSPSAAALYAETGSLSSDSSAFACLSAAPGRTAFSLIILIGFVSIWIWASRMAGDRRTMIRLTYIMGIAGGLWCLMLGFAAIGLPVSFGASGQAAAFHIGLPVNPNHTSGVLAMFSLMALGSAVTRRHHSASSRRILWIVIYLMLSAALVLLQSRGALLGWGFGHLIILAYAILNQRKSGLKIGIIVVCVLAAVLGIVLVISAQTVGKIKAEFESSSLQMTADSNDELMNSREDDIMQSPVFSKTQMYGSFVDMTKEWRQFGTGRSAFADVYPAYQDFAFPKRFRHAENEYWEIILEYGWGWGALILLIGAVGIFRLFRAFLAEPNERGCIYGLLAGVMAILIQNCFDFSLRYWTVGLQFWVACGILEARRIRWKYGRPSEENVPKRRFLRIEWAAGCAIMAIALTASVVCLRSAIDGQTESSLSALEEAVKSGDQSQVQALLNKNLCICPADASLRALMAENSLLKAERSKQEENWYFARKWLESAVKHAPRNAMFALHLGKVCRALGDSECASAQFIRAAQNDARLIPLAMEEFAALGGVQTDIPNHPAMLRAYASAMMHQGNVAGVLSAVRRVEDSGNENLAAEIEYSAYKMLGFIEGCDEIAERYANSRTIGGFRIQNDYLVRRGDYEALLKYVESRENDLHEYEDYWRIRLYDSVFYGDVRGMEWYASAVPGIVLRYREIARQSAQYRFYTALCDAQYGLKLGQTSRAVRSAQEALRLRPNHDGARKILNAARKKDDNQMHIYQ